MRPTAFFYVRCSLSSSDIQQHYATAMDKRESTKLTAVTHVSRSMVFQGWFRKCLSQAHAVAFASTGTFSSGIAAKRDVKKLGVSFKETVLS